MPRPAFTAWRLSAALCVLLLAVAPRARGDECCGPWVRELVDQPNAVTVDIRQRKDGYAEFRGTTQVRSSLSALVALLRDVPQMPQWVYRTREARVVREIAQTELIIHSVARAVWPLHDRDLVVRTRLQQDPETLRISIDGQSVPHWLPEIPGLVRVPYLRSHWTFLPLPDGQVRVTFHGYGDAGGSLTSGLLNWFSRLVLAEAPHQTLIGLRAMLGREPYRHARLSFIREPAGSGDPVRNHGG